jgi:hypothetical protein
VERRRGLDLLRRVPAVDKVIVIAQATVTYQQIQYHLPVKTEDAHNLGFYCGARGCWADVEYLLNDKDKGMILKLAEVPTSKPTITQPQPPRK